MVDGCQRQRLPSDEHDWPVYQRIPCCKPQSLIYDLNVESGEQNQYIFVPAGDLMCECIDLITHGTLKISQNFFLSFKINLNCQTDNVSGY